MGNIYYSLTQWLSLAFLMYNTKISTVDTWTRGRAVCVGSTALYAIDRSKYHGLNILNAGVYASFKCSEHITLPSVLLLDSDVEIQLGQTACDLSLLNCLFWFC